MNKENLRHSGFFVFLVSGHLDDKVLGRIEWGQRDVAGYLLGNRILARLANLVVLEQVAVAFVLVEELLNLGFQVLRTVVGIPVLQSHFVDIVHQNLLHSVENANDRILLHGIEVAVVEGGVVEGHHTSFAIDHRNDLVVHQ